MSKTETTARGGPMRNIAYFFLILFLITATIAVVAGAFFGYTTIRGVKSVSDPISELVRQLVVEATPVILPNPVVIIEEINSLARLETASYAFQDILQIQRNEELMWGVFGESMLFVAYGDVIAGVDLAQMGPQDLQVVSPTKVMVRLPKAEILIIDLDNDRSYVADRDIGFLSRGDPQLETKIRQEAEARMVESAMENGILEMADEEAQAFMFSFLEQLGFLEIEFTEGVIPVLTPYVQEVPKGFVLTPETPVLATPAP